MKMDYMSSWQSVVAAANNTGAVSLSRPSHYVNVSTSSPTCRSMWWRVLLDVLPKDNTKWLSTVRLQRSEYDELRRRVSVTPGITEDADDLALNNPLSQHTQSSWNQYFEDSELKRQIRQDVVRTFPEERYFHLPLVQEAMVAILFCYARDNVHISYKQGLHEVLAPLLLALHSDHQDFELAKKQRHFPPLIQEIMDPVYLEHDAYALFNCVLKRLSQWYLSKEEPAAPLPPSVLQQQPFATATHEPPLPCGLSPLLQRIQHIHGPILSTHLPTLAAHLRTLDIPPQVYAIRWLRLLFGREFGLTDALVVWDSIFWTCTDRDLPLVDHIALALLDTLSNNLLGSDYLGCLNLLMRPPQGVDVTALLTQAIHTFSGKTQVLGIRQRHSSADDMYDDATSSTSSLSAAPYASLPPLPQSSTTTLRPSPSSSYPTTQQQSSVPRPHPSTLDLNNTSSSTTAAVNGAMKQRVSYQQPSPKCPPCKNGGAAENTSSINGHAPCVARGQSVHGVPSSAGTTTTASGVQRSRSQVTRCASEGGGVRKVGRHPSASPRRNNTDQVVTYSAYRDTVEAETTSSHKSNLLNFVKFGTVKFSKPKEQPQQHQQAARIMPSGSAVSGVSGRMLEDMSSVRTGRGGGGEGTPSRYRAGKEGEQLVDSLQRLAGELTGHLAALSHRHHQLSMGADLSVRVTMDSLRQVSQALQDIADGQDWDTTVTSPPHLPSAVTHTSRRQHTPSDDALQHDTPTTDTLQHAIPTPVTLQHNIPNTHYSPLVHPLLPSPD